MPTPYDEQIFSVPDIIDGERIVLHAERLVPDRRRVLDRVARISKRVVAERRRIEVDVLHEELCIEYESGDGFELTGDKPAELRILLYAEEPEVVKIIRAVEEVRVSTRAATKVRKFSETVRHEVLD